MHAHGHIALRRAVHGMALLLVALIALSPLCALAQTEGRWQAADTIQKAMNSAQLSLYGGDSADATSVVADATETFQTSIAPLAQGASAPAVASLDAALEAADTAISTDDQPAFAAASGQVQTALYRLSYEQTLAAIDANDVDGANQWLLLRAYRQVSRFERLNGDATRTLADLRAGTIDTAAARAAIMVDLLDTYQSRLNMTLHDIQASDQRELPAGRAQQAALAAGYFAILSPAFREQRDEAARTQTTAMFDQLVAQASTGSPVGDLLPEIDAALRGFRAAPLSEAETARRAGQLLQFTKLIGVEYARGVKGGVVTIPLEIQEAATFRDGAAAAFADLRTLLDERDPAKTEQVASAFADLEQQLLRAKDGSAIAEPAAIQTATDNITTLLQGIMPAEWQKHDASADFDVIAASLDQMERAVSAKQYDVAESARLSAYAILESGPEAKLQAFAPQLIPTIEELFWYGQGKDKGLAALIRDRAPKEQVSRSRAALDAQLAQAQTALGGNSAPGAVAANAALIVFREGLEAVLILASLMGSMKLGEQRRLRRPLWLGATAALLASAATWIVARELLTTLARYGERLEAVVSLVAIGVLLLITNWFFHDVYWTGWMANFHRQKKRMIGGTGQFLGLIILGFTSIYREGFETVLFLQALVLDSGTATVLGGVAVGLAGTALLGLLVFVVQAKLPHKKMLIFTGILIGAVLLQMVGNTVHVLQVVGWLPIHVIPGLNTALPYWVGMWFGFYATWEGLFFQFAAAAFTIGSYFLAERKHRRPASPRPTPPLTPSGSQAR